jgi:hypothetical protein
MIHTDGTPTIAHRSVTVDHLPDVLITSEGSLFLVQPVSRKGREWISESVDPDAQKWGDSIVVEHRYIEALFDGMVDDGLVVR